MTSIHDVFPADVVDRNKQISEKILLKGEDQYPFSKCSLVAILTASKRLCGWRRKREQNSSPSYIVGSKPTILDYEFNVGPEIGSNQQTVVLHTPVVV
jgi:hypothetical protein